MSKQPRRRNAEVSRKALLDAARLEFAQKGLAGARVDDIAARAGVNKQLVYHHFGDKDALYLAVLEQAYEDIRAHEHTLNLADLPPTEAMQRLIESSFEYLAAHPEFVALLNDENRLHAQHVRSSSRLPRMHSPLVQTIGDVLKRGIRAGVFREGVNPMQLYISIAGLGYFYFSNRGTLSAIFGKRLDTRAAETQRKKHVVDLVMAALRT